MQIMYKKLQILFTIIINTKLYNEIENQEDKK